MKNLDSVKKALLINDKFKERELRIQKAKKMFQKK